MSEYLKIPEVARRLDVSEKTARRYIRSGELPSTFIGGAYRVSEEDLANYQEGAKVNPEELPNNHPKDQAQALLSEDQAERSLQLQEGRRKAHGQFYDNAKKLSDGQLRQLRDSLIEDLSKGRAAERLDRPDLWKDPRAQYEEVASRLWTIEALLDIRDEKATPGVRAELDALSG